jgi:hypothetical protein
MKCYSCDRQPIRACLNCGSFYCEEHGQYNSPPKFQGNWPNTNSLCSQCSIKSKSQSKTVALVFCMIAIVELPIGITIMVATGKLMPGGIFALQSIIFGIVALILFVKQIKANENRRL